jgi:peroxiredoxin Q/BCP
MLKVGDTAPDFTALDDSGRKVRLKDLRGRQVVLYFYPKDDTPGCTQEACDFRDRHTAFTARGAVVLGVSVDPVASHAKFKTKHGLPFPLLSDEDHHLVEAYGVWKEKSLYGRKFMGIERTTFSHRRKRQDRGDPPEGQSQRSRRGAAGPGFWKMSRYSWILLIRNTAG